jgi:hypothetical protein
MRLSVIKELPAVLTLMLLLFVAAMIARTYIGDSHSPYGMCYAPSGRTVPCDAIKTR